MIDVQKANKVLALTKKGTENRTKLSQVHCVNLGLTCKLGILGIEICSRTGRGSEMAAGIIKGLKLLQSKK